MARLNVYVPDDLANRARTRGLNISALTQAAIAAELERSQTTAWLAGVGVTNGPRREQIPHEEAIKALDKARDEFEG